MTALARGALLVGGALLVWLAIDLLLLLFAGILLAIFLRSLAQWVSRRTGLATGWALAAVVLTLVGAVVLAGVLYAPSLAAQGDLLTQRIPRAASEVSSWLSQYAWGRWALERVSSTTPGGGDMMGQASAAFDWLTNGVVAIVVILFAGGYLAAEPTPYIRGVLHVVPQSRRTRAAEALYATGHVLKWWLFGQALAMTVVGLAMGIGLSIIGVQLAPLLGVLAALFEFIPLLGPVIAVGPALLLALANSTQQAAYVLVLYAIVQTAEGYVLTPLVQRKAVELPPVLTISAQVGLGWAAGPIGLLVAVPLTAVALVLVQMLYLVDRLGDDEAGPEFESVARADVERERTRTLRGLLLPEGREAHLGSASRGIGE